MPPVTPSDASNYASIWFEENSSKRTIEWSKQGLPSTLGSFGIQISNTSDEIADATKKFTEKVADRNRSATERRADLHHFARALRNSVEDLASLVTRNETFDARLADSRYFVISLKAYATNLANALDQYEASSGLCADVFRLKLYDKLSRIYSDLVAKNALKEDELIDIAQAMRWHGRAGRA
jgi:hypothetical protein